MLLLLLPASEGNVELELEFGFESVQFDVGRMIPSPSTHVLQAFCPRTSTIICLSIYTRITGLEGRRGTPVSVLARRDWMEERIEVDALPYGCAYGAWRCWWWSG